MTRPATATGAAASVRTSDVAQRIALLLVLFAAFGLRTFDIERNPPELFEDELAGAASAWSIVTTGHDVETTHLPFLVTRLEWKQPIYGFATVPFQALLGHTIRAVRLPAILFGVLATALVFWAARVVGRSRWEAIAAAGLFAIVPWAVHYGRIGWEPSAVLPFTIAGVGLLWRGLARHQTRYVVASAAGLALGGYAYQPALLVHAALAGAIVIVLWRHLRRTDIPALALGGLIAALILLPYLAALTDPAFTKRTATISVFRDGINAGALGLAWDHYWAQWNPQFLFLEGTANLRNEPAMGVLMPILFPLLVLGIAALVQRRRAADLLLLAWLIVGPIAAALTDDGVPHFARGIFALPAIVLTMATGAVAAARWLARAGETAAGLRNPTAAIAIGLIVFAAAPAYRFYFTDYPRVSAGAWHAGTAAALGLVRNDVPANSTVCLETPTISYWTFPQHVAWYLGGTNLSIVEGTSDARCARSGTWGLGSPDSKRPAAAQVVAQVPQSGDRPTFILWRNGAP
jgi:4-amino-4-deoxy-L-arabinose transferase-like glycosyltransferase